ncbi:glycosyltransferase family 2 protein, partial [Nitrospira sp. BLG_2]|uniref:glycosyltransferase family 2 protein n=1 Tax=Nitrospira sp. BLG_2 TaxID=3397507 RepID=UPI003B9D1CAC
MKDYSTSSAAAVTESLNSQAGHILMSVVIPTFDRPDLLRRCLASLIAQTMNPAMFEIIVVSDGPSESTEGVAAAFRGKRSAPNLRYLASPVPRGPAAARNLGWKSARGPILSFTNDD